MVTRGAIGGNQFSLLCPNPIYSAHENISRALILVRADVVVGSSYNHRIAGHGHATAEGVAWRAICGRQLSLLCPKSVRTSQENISGALVNISADVVSFRADNC